MNIIGNPLSKLVFTENFETTEWNIRDKCPYGTCCFGRGCFRKLGCNNGAPMFVRLLSTDGTCGYSGLRKVYSWTGVGTRYHGNDSISGNWLLAHTPPNLSNQPAPPISEIFTSRRPHTNGSGRMSVDFYIHGPNVKASHNEHYVIAHNLNIRGLPECSQDCENLPGAYVVKNESNVNEFLFYGVIAGNFGNKSLAGEKGCKDIQKGFSCRGFVVEIRTPEGVFLPKETFFPYTENDEFPSKRWYRVEINWNRESGIYSYSVRTLRSGVWTLLVTKSIAEQVFLSEGRKMLPPGLIGITGVWSEPTRGSDVVHADWDNISVNW